MTRGSGIHQGKFRIYEQFLKQDSSENNIAFLKNEYGIGGAYPAVSGRNLDESHDAKGIKISRGRISQPDAELLLRWNKVEKRIGELIRADRYLSQAEKDDYPAYREQAEARRKRGEISEEFRSIVYDYNDFVAQLGEESKALNLYYLSSCWGAFGVGEKKMHARTAEGDFILPMMREAMNAIIADNTHLTARCEAMLEALNSDVAKSLEPTVDELNPPPEPRKEYRYHLGDAVYIGIQEYAEIKALCAGNPHIKEKMDLDIDVSRLKLLKANHLSQRYSLEDQILKEFPQKIKSLEQRIEGYKADIDQLKRNTEPNEDGFSPMIMPGGTVREKKAAGDAILGLCKSMTSPEPIPIGQYRGFDMELSFDTFSREYKITLIHQLRHTVTLGTDIFGNIQRLDNTLGAFEERMAACTEQLENTRVQLENAKAEVQKPFPQEEELAAKTARLNELNALLNLDKSENEIVDGERGDEEPTRSCDDRER